MSGPSVRNKQIADEAAEWAVTLDAGELSDRQKHQLTDWLLESPRHVEELLLAASLFSSLGDVDRDKTISIDTLLSAAAPEVVTLMKDRPAEPKTNVETESNRRQRRRWTAAAAAALIVIGAGLWTVFFSAPGGEPITGFATALGEQRSVTLEDGSIIHVNTQSEVAIRYGDDARVVDLLRGEALFEVTRDPQRPFRVIAGETVAEAVGTTFNVYRRGERTTVAVLEGKVAVDTDIDGAPNAKRLEDGRLLLGSGEKADVAAAEKSIRVAVANTEAVSSWRARQLVFEGDTLATIATEFNRYNRIRIVVLGEDLAVTEFSGVFDADDPQSFIAFLELSGDVAVDQSAGEIRLSSAR